MHYHRNQQYSIIALTDGVGAISERYAYSAYGEVTVLDDSGTATTSDNRYTYTGREWDGALSLYHYRVRMYDSQSGRFLGRDPIGYADVMNFYATYFFLSWIDPLGTDTIVRGTDDEKIYYNGVYCWKHVEDSCGKIIGIARVPCPSLPGDDTPFNDLDLPSFLDVIEDGLTANGIYNSTKGLPQADPTTTKPHTPIISNVIFDVIQTFPEFGKDGSPCRDWYRDTINAFTRANAGDCSLCASISTENSGSGASSADNSYHQILTQNGSGSGLAADFAELAQALSRYCAAMCRR